MAAVDSSTDHHFLPIESLPLIDLRLLSQSELYSLSLYSSSSSASHLHRRSDDDAIIPKIDRSVFNESAGSRKQTFSRIRLASRNNQIPPVSASTIHIDRHNLEPVDEENAQIIGLLQQLFGVESVRWDNYDDNILFPVQVEFKDPLAESGTVAFQNIPIDVVDGGPRKRKRGRPRKNENVGSIEEKPKSEGGEAMTMVNNSGVLVDAVALANMEDPFGDELRRRTEGLENESQLLEFMEGLTGEWGSQRKKRRIVQASDFGDVLPREWRIMLSLKRRGGCIWIVCRRYISPEGHQFVSCKEVSSYLLSFFGPHGIIHSKSSHIAGSLQFSSKMASENLQQDVGCVPAIDINVGDDASSLHILGTSTGTDHEKQAIIFSSIGCEKQNSSNENINNDLGSGSKVGHTISGIITDFDHQGSLLSMDDGILKADENNNNSVEGYIFEGDGVCNTHNEKLFNAIEANDVTCNLGVPMVVTTSFANNNNNASFECSDGLNAVKCISANSNFVSNDGNAGCYETVPCGNEQVCVVKNNGHELSLRSAEDPRQQIGFESRIVTPNSEGKRFSGDSIEDRHLISSLEDMKISKGKQYENDDCQLEIKDVSISNELLSSSEGCSCVTSQNEHKHGSVNSIDRVLTSITNYSAKGKSFISGLFSSSIGENSFVASSFVNDVSFSTCTQDASKRGGVDVGPNLKLNKDFTDNHDSKNEVVVRSSAQESRSLNEQSFNCIMDNPLGVSFERNLLTPTSNQHPCAFENNANKVSAVTSEAVKAVEGGCNKSQLDIVSCGNDAAVVDSYTAASNMQERSQSCLSVPLSSSIIPNQFEEQSCDGVNNASKCCLTEKAKSGRVEICKDDEALFSFHSKQIESDGDVLENMVHEKMS